MRKDQSNDRLRIRRTREASNQKDLDLNCQMRYSLSS